jgi:hypothetical protein
MVHMQTRLMLAASHGPRFMARILNTPGFGFPIWRLQTGALVISMSVPF